uniref:Non-haem dioxygenase N-terminal domain-containing protein n=1 Tax=Oryza punctata TaxID=4537 RepID=A0A0E0LD39_ORYPU
MYKVMAMVSSCDARPWLWLRADKGKADITVRCLLRPRPIPIPPPAPPTRTPYSTPPPPVPCGWCHVGGAAGACRHPNIDISRLANSRDVDEAAKLRSVLQSDWPQHAEPFLDEILAAMREFFHLSPEKKEMYRNVVDADDGGGDRFHPEGYRIDHVDTDKKILDWCDRLYLEVQPEEERRLDF